MLKLVALLCWTIVIYGVLSLINESLALAMVMMFCLPAIILRVAYMVKES